MAFSSGVASLKGNLLWRFVEYQVRNSLLIAFRRNQAAVATDSTADEISRPIGCL
jgi:hypothetical protein